jgi:uncharacterized protein YqgV (UPF0045/DUF77 family)
MGKQKHNIHVTLPIIRNNIHQNTHHSMSVIIQFAMFPTDKGSSVSIYVSRIIAMLHSEGYHFQLTPMATIVETESIEQALEVVSKSYKLLEPDSERVYVTANLDIKKGNLGRLSAKVASVREKLPEGRFISNLP